MSKEAFGFLTDNHHSNIRRVVTLEYPRKGLLSLGLVTGSIKNSEGRTLLVVYVPTSPAPNSGSVVILPEEEVYETDLNMAAACKMIVTWGAVSPSFLRKSEGADEVSSKSV